MTQRNIQGHQPHGKPLDTSNPPQGGSAIHHKPDARTLVGRLRDISQRNVINTTEASVRAILMRGNDVIDEVELPDYGETTIVTHQAKVTFVETGTKRKVE